jgi:hypothetical protein
LGFYSIVMGEMIEKFRCTFSKIMHPSRIILENMLEPISGAALPRAEQRRTCKGIRCEGGGVGCREGADEKEARSRGGDMCSGATMHLYSGDTEAMCVLSF